MNLPHLLVFEENVPTRRSTLDVIKDEEQWTLCVHRVVPIQCIVQDLPGCGPAIGMVGKKLWYVRWIRVGVKPHYVPSFFQISSVPLRSRGSG